MEGLRSFTRVEMQKRKAAREEREVKEKRRLKREMKKQSQEGPQPKKLKETWIDDTVITANVQTKLKVSGHVQSDASIVYTEQPKEKTQTTLAFGANFD